MRSTKYSLLIICEGENTESLFFNSIRDAILNGYYDCDANIRIKPEPKDTSNISTTNPHKSKRKARQTKAVPVGEEPTIINAPLPLKWVLEARKDLEDGTCNEAWVVFDHDDHPARKEAFDEAAKLVNGCKVKIAFSSRSFEYYLLLHFERVFKSFETSECRDKNNSDPKKRKKTIECSTNVHTNDCHGEKCIGGYARSKGYWESSKKSESTFGLIKDKLEVGFENSAWLRAMSDVTDSDKAIYDRNPYVTVDSIVKRLTGYEKADWLWLKTNTLYPINDIEIAITSEKKLCIKNNSKRTLLITENSFQEIKSDNTRVDLDTRFLVGPSEEKEYNIDGDADSWFLFHLDDNHNLMFSFST